MFGHGERVENRTETETTGLEFLDLEHRSTNPCTGPVHTELAHMKLGYTGWKGLDCTGTWEKEVKLGLDLIGKLANLLINRGVSLKRLILYHPEMLLLS